MNDVQVIGVVPAPSDGSSVVEAPRRGRRLAELVDRVLLQSGARQGQLPWPQVYYPLRFKMLGAVVVCVSVAWVANYLLQVVTAIRTHKDTPCRSSDSQLTYNANMLFLYFIWFALSRLALFIPCITMRVALVQSSTHGFCRTYCVHLAFRDGPLYIFVVGSLLFWLHLMQSPSCERRSPELYSTLKGYAAFSCLASILFLIFAYWHNKLLTDAVRSMAEQVEIRARAAPDVLVRLQTRVFDPADFGDEDDKLYPLECAICLLNWEPDDYIKVTPCGHVFHEECIGNWLDTAHTCALCRQDLRAISSVAPLHKVCGRVRRDGAGGAPSAVSSPSSEGADDDVPARAWSGSQVSPLRLEPQAPPGSIALPMGVPALGDEELSGDSPFAPMPPPVGWEAAAALEGPGTPADQYSRSSGLSGPTS